jgi:predicted nucleic acid-binding protein
MIGGVEPVFVDTNVLVFAAVSRAPLHDVARRALEHHRASGAEMWISRQVLREYLAVLTRPQTFTMPLPMTDLAADVRRFQAVFRVAEDGPTGTEYLLSLLEQVTVGGRQIHDANIVATMQAHNVQRLLTHNPADFARFAGLITVIPLVPS